MTEFRTTPRSCWARSARRQPPDCSMPSAATIAASIKSPRQSRRSAGRSSGCSCGRSKLRSLASAEVRPWHWARFARWLPAPRRSSRLAWPTPTGLVRAAFPHRHRLSRSASRRIAYRPCGHAARRIRQDSHPGHHRSSRSQLHAMTAYSVISWVCSTTPTALVQRQAIDTIRSLGPPGRKSLTLVIGKLKSPNPDVRLAAAELIGSHGQAAADAVPALSLLLDDATPKIRTVAARTLGKLGKAAQPAFTQLTSLLGADQVEVREAAASALGSLELDADWSFDLLSPKHSGTTNSDVRRAATRAIQKLGPQGSNLRSRHHLVG